jgi:hypothetical protein
MSFKMHYQGLCIDVTMSSNNIKKVMCDDIEMDNIPEDMRKSIMQEFYKLNN